MTVDEPSVIDLGELPRGPEDGTAPEPRRPLSRRLLALAGVGLLAVGFAAGMAVQRAITPHRPRPSPSVVDYYDLGRQFSGCGEVSGGGPDWTYTDSRCSGVVQFVYDGTVGLTLDSSGSPVTFTVDDDTQLTGITSLDEFHAGLHVTVRLAPRNGHTPRAAWLVVA